MSYRAGTFLRERARKKIKQGDVADGDGWVRRDRQAGARDGEGGPLEAAGASAAKGLWQE